MVVWLDRCAPQTSATEVALSHSACCLHGSAIALAWRPGHDAVRSRG